jgi:hypothetical protein
MALFLVHSKIKLAARPAVFLVGEIKSGTIHAGMIVRVVDDNHVVAAPIPGVEFVEYPGGQSQVALRLAFDNAVDEEVVAALCVRGTTIEVVEANP